MPFKLFGVTTNHNDIRDFNNKGEKWEGNYDETKNYTLFGEISCRPGSNDSFLLDDSIYFAHGDITSSNCALVQKKVFKEFFNAPSKIEFYYPDDFKPVISSTSVLPK